MENRMIQAGIYLLIFMGLFVGAYTDIRERKIIVRLYFLEVPVLLALNHIAGKLDGVWIMETIGIFLLFYFVSVVTKEQFGKGDALVLSMTEAGLGIQRNLILLYVALVLAFVVSLFLLLLKKAGKKTTLPFVAFLFVSYVAQMVAVFVR